ncbi:MAG TPA: TonB-dependent receptor [Methylosinus sp.]|uniref:TonB-dependent receptor n=1 Tax=Methylosinus sp. TaxID=427 RepID=UPI002F91E7E7
MARKKSVGEGVNMSSTAIALALSAMTLGAQAPVTSAQASISPQERAGTLLHYQIPAGAMETALNAFADRSGLHIVFDVGLTDAVKTRGVLGAYSVREGLDRLLFGTGLSYRLSENGRSVSIILAQASRGTMTDASGEELPPIDIGAEQKRISGASTAPGFDAERAKEPIYRDPPGQTVTTVDHKFLETTPMQTVQDMLQYSPGVSIAQGTIPRELLPSIRGSGNRLGMTYPFSVRNIMLYEDGFPIVTADGNGRTDMLDPHSFAGVDVYRGPSSAMFGNYAYGGAINFRSLTGAQIDGVETGSEFGSFGYFNNYLRAGKKFTDRDFGDFDISFFGSDTRGDGYLARGAHAFDQGKVLATWTPVPTDRLTFKFLASSSFAEFMNRSSLTQFYTNPYGKTVSCRIATPANLPFCNNLNAPANGSFTSAASGLSNQSVWQLGTHWHVMRDIVGLRYEHDFDNATTWRTQFSYDYLDYINSTWPPPKVGPAALGGLGGPVAIRGPSFGFSASTDITNHGAIFGLPATHYLGFFYDALKSDNPLYSQVPNAWGYGAIGGAVGNIESNHSNIGIRAREEIALTPQLTAAIGFSSNWNRISGVYTVYNYAASGAMTRPTQVGVDNEYWNTAPEASLTYRFSPEWQIRARYATGYGTPNFMYLTNTPTGAGNNTSLKAQTNMGVDLGVDWTPAKNLTASVTLYNEWFRNEILTQANGLVSYQLNAPASIHRGVEASVDWRPFDRWRLIAAYSYNDQFFTNFWDNLSSTIAYNRSGNRIPNVPTHTLTSRVGYDIADGDFKGLGAFVEYVFKSSYTIDNANLTSVPGYGLVNLNLHYSRPITDSYVKNIEVYFDVKNLFDHTYVAGANVLTNTLVTGTAVQTPAVLLANSTGASIIAGSPRAFIGGVKFKF